MVDHAPHKATSYFHNSFYKILGTILIKIFVSTRWVGKCSFHFILFCFINSYIVAVCGRSVSSDSSCSFLLNCYVIILYIFSSLVCGIFPIWDYLSCSWIVNLKFYFVSHCISYSLISHFYFCVKIRDSFCMIRLL